MSAVLHAFHDEAASAQRLAQALAIPLALVESHCFPDGELLPKIPRPAETTLIYRSLDRPNDKLIELLLACEAWRRLGAKRLVLIAPYLCYMRQDASFSPGEPVSQTVIGALLGRAFNRILTVDAHLHRTSRLSEVFPGTECLNITAADAIVTYLRRTQPPSSLVVIGPDEESKPWVDAIAGPLGVDGHVFNKRRRGDRDVIVTPPEGLNAAGRAVMIVDDICSSGGTLIACIRAIRAAGADTVNVVVTHALFNDATRRSIIEAGATEIISTDSCQHPTNAVYLADDLAKHLHAETKP